MDAIKARFVVWAMKLAFRLACSWQRWGGWKWPLSISLLLIAFRQVTMAIFMVPGQIPLACQVANHEVVYVMPVWAEYLSLAAIIGLMSVALYLCTRVETPCVARNEGKFYLGFSLLCGYLLGMLTISGLNPVMLWAGPLAGLVVLVVSGFDSDIGRLWLFRRWFRYTALCASSGCVAGVGLWIGFGWAVISLAPVWLVALMVMAMCKPSRKRNESTLERLGPAVL